MNHVLYLGFLRACKHSAEIIVYVSNKSKYTLVPPLKQPLLPGLRIAEGLGYGTHPPVQVGFWVFHLLSYSFLLTLFLHVFTCGGAVE